MLEHFVDRDILAGRQAKKEANLKIMAGFFWMRISLKSCLKRSKWSHFLPLPWLKLCPTGELSLFMLRWGFLTGWGGCPNWMLNFFWGGGAEYCDWLLNYDLNQQIRILSTETMLVCFLFEWLWWWWWWCSKFSESRTPDLLLLFPHLAKSMHSIIFIEWINKWRTILSFPGKHSSHLQPTSTPDRKEPQAL